MSSQKTMQTWQKHFPSSEPVQVTIPIPTPPPDGLLIKIHAAGVCHSDFALLNMQTRSPYMNERYTLGHEGAGEIVELGNGVESSKWSVGDRVAILSVAGCQSPKCGECSRDLGQLCQTGEHYGIGSDGAYAPYIAVKEHAVTKLPDGVSYEVGAVATDACMTAYHAVVGTGKVKKGETVLVLGLGGLGFNGMQIARARGARVIVRDNRKEVLREAVRFGVDEGDVVPSDREVDEWVGEKGLVVDTVVDFVGKEETFEAGQKCGMFCRDISPYLCCVRVLMCVIHSPIRGQTRAGWSPRTQDYDRQLPRCTEAVADLV